MSVSFALNKKLLDLGARFNSVALCSLAFGNASMGVNSRALLIAFENKSYAAAGYLLDRAAECGVPGPCDYLLGADWDRAEAIAKTDKRAGELMEKYERDSDHTFNEIRAAMFQPD